MLLLQIKNQSLFSNMLFKMLCFEGFLYTIFTWPDMENVSD